MAANGSTAPPNPFKESYPQFTLSSLGLGRSEKPENPIVYAPPCVEVLPSEDLSEVNLNVESVVINDEITLLKGRASTFDVFGVGNSDLVPGKYEGGLKLWEGSIDLVRNLYLEVREGKLELRGKRVLELGCGHGLPGIFAGLEGAAAVHFQDFNSEVLQVLTITNVKVNHILDSRQDQSLAKCKGDNISPDVRYFAGDWSEVHKLLPYDGYDVILMAETVYALSSLNILYGLLKKALQRPSGVIYMSGKKHYFGVGGGTRQFQHLVEEDGVMEAVLLAEVADGSSNVREVWKFSLK